LAWHLFGSPRPASARQGRRLGPAMEGRQDAANP
jgi:hypothetical protein